VQAVQSIQNIPIRQLALKRLTSFLCENIFLCFVRLIRGNAEKYIPRSGGKNTDSLPVLRSQW
jgi:hypothetical protein